LGDGVIAVDYFCGAGGWTTGAMQAGIHVAAAVNHWQRAVDTHSANHPQTRHYCQDAGLLDPRDLPAHDVLIASPSCQGHSRARGKDMARHDASRATAWCVVDVAEVTRPRLILVENVVEMRAWVLYPLWRQALERLGYSLSENVLNAADFGVPQERVRFFAVAVRGKRAPQITPPVGLMREQPCARDILDEGAAWSPVATPRRAKATLDRVDNGRREHGRRFLFSYYGSTKGGRSVDRPLGTVTTRDRWAIVDGDRMRMLSVEEYRRAMGFPDGYLLTGTQKEQVMQLGNAVVPAVAAEVIRQAVAA
jgi:DNA (cytosine-5)-methyltransferase 1